MAGPKSQQAYTFSLPSFSTHLIPAFTSISSLQILIFGCKKETGAAALPQLPPILHLHQPSTPTFTFHFQHQPSLFAAASIEQEEGEDRCCCCYSRCSCRCYYCWVVRTRVKEKNQLPISSFHQPQNHLKLTKNPRTPALFISSRCCAAAVTGQTKRETESKGAG